MTSERTPSCGKPAPWQCGGELAIFIADESSYRCTECGWIGWPQKRVEEKTGRIICFYPHIRGESVYRAAHRYESRLGL